MYLKQAFLFSFLIFGVAQAQHKLVQLWQTDSILRVPESVKFNPQSKFLYVSNIEGQPWGKDGRGSISVLNSSGKMINQDWVTGLNAPKGMTIYKQDLFVADLNELIQIDTKEGSILEKHAIPGAEGLNDVTVDAQGKFYISDSKSKKVFIWQNGRSEVYVEGLKGPNGMLFHQGKLYLLDAGSLYQVLNSKEKVLVAEGMDGGTDGIEAINDHSFLVSCWSGAIWFVDLNGTKQLLLDTRTDKVNAADIGYDPKKKIVFVPTFFRNSVAAYQFQ
jgi:sugar lactone lactonase YvrE